MQDLRRKGVSKCVELIVADEALFGNKLEKIHKVKENVRK
jgi:hypothetical protein